MWYVMANFQQSYDLSDRLIRAISHWQTVTDDDIEALLDAGADVNRIHGTLLPLHCACMVADIDCVRLLIERGAHVNLIDGYGRAAIHYAAEKDALCVELLLEHGAELNIPDNNRDTALHWACFKNQVRCVKTLLQNGAKVNAVDFNNDTPLSWAAQKGNLETIKILLEYNAKVDTQNFNGLTPLMLCARIQASGLNYESDDACLELLLKANGQFDMRDRNGELPMPFSMDNRLRELLLPQCQNPCSLQKLCRFVTRSNIGDCYLPNVIPKLPLPEMLKDYVMLQR